MNLSHACCSGPGHERAAPTAHLGGKGAQRQAATGSICAITLFLNQALHLELHSALFGLEFKYQQRVAPRLKRRSRSA